MLKYALTAVAVTSALGVAACGSTKDSADNSSAPAATATAASGGGAIKEGLKIAFLPKQINNPYFTISDKGGEDAVTAGEGGEKRGGPAGATAAPPGGDIHTLATQQQEASVHSANAPNP